MSTTMIALVRIGNFVFGRYQYSSGDLNFSQDRLLRRETSVLGGWCNGQDRTTISDIMAC